VTSTLLRRGGRIGLLVFVVLAFVTLVLTWVKVAGGPSFVGLDMHNISDEVPNVDNPLTRLFLEIAPLPAYIALLLSPTVGVRARWARIVGVILVVLAGVLTAVVAVGLYSETEPGWSADRSDHYRAYAAAVGLLALLLLAAAVLLASDRRGPYHGLVAALLLCSAAFQFGNVAVLHGRKTDAVTITLAPWATGLGYLLAGVCVVVAGIGYAHSAADGDDAAVRYEASRVAGPPR
jgi:hypothetical protein